MTFIEIYGVTLYNALYNALLNADYDHSA